MDASEQVPAGWFSHITDAVARPASGMTWTQLAAATVFVIVVAIAWRMVIGHIVGE